MATAVGSALCQSQQTLREPDALHQPLEPPQAAPHRVAAPASNLPSISGGLASHNATCRRGGAAARECATPASLG
ncbi:membrane protein [Micractinium conductrix]|uniref:Membrane protein n=1 Tax=Micractinium conductrix TaxID=554055 RepID=A0A2P6VND6_9CHLO|nr:membrane protein [Micractinium conductrix]|eukprot:PSC75604.1 membrane protein [Micractinium conductrix]